MKIKIDENTTVYPAFLNLTRSKQLKHLKDIPSIGTDAKAEKLLEKIPKKKGNKRAKNAKDNDREVQE